MRTRQEDNTRKHDNRPVHTLSSRIRCFREEAQHERNDQERQRDIIDERAVAAKGPATREEGFTAEALEAHAANGGDVGEEEGGVGE